MINGLYLGKTSTCSLRHTQGNTVGLIYTFVNRLSFCVCDTHVHIINSSGTRQPCFLSMSVRSLNNYLIMQLSMFIAIETPMITSNKFFNLKRMEKHFMLFGKNFTWKVHFWVYLVDCYPFLHSNTELYIMYVLQVHNIQWNAGMGNADTLRPNSCFCWRVKSDILQLIGCFSLCEELGL